MNIDPFNHLVTILFPGDNGSVVVVECVLREINVEVDSCDVYTMINPLETVTTVAGPTILSFSGVIQKEVEVKPLDIRKSKRVEDFPRL